MQIVILAGGIGSRLWPLTKEVPKPMVPVGGVPYLERQLRFIAGQGLRDVVLLTAYLGEQIEDYFGDGGRLGLSLRYSREPEPLGTGGALRNALHLLDDLFVVIYGDSYLPIDYAPVGRHAAGQGSMGAVVVYRDADGATGVRANIALSADGRIARYDKRAADDPELMYIDAGVLSLRREALDFAPAAAKFSLEEDVFPRLIERRALLGLPTGQRFYDIGTFERLRTIAEVFA